jgi:DNA-binding FadR family transcriptional regulator
LLEIRKILEVEVRRSCGRARRARDVEAMRLQLGLHAGIHRGAEGYVDADVEFHALLAARARHEVLLAMLEPVVAPA